MYQHALSHSLQLLICNMQDVDRFIEIYLAFAFATPAELGIDSPFHKAPLHPKSRDPANASNNTSTNAGPGG
jgi:hypothetical protein